MEMGTVATFKTRCVGKSCQDWVRKLFFVLVVGFVSQSVEQVNNISQCKKTRNSP